MKLNNGQRDRQVDHQDVVIQWADWQVWSEKFLARARRKGFKDVLLGKVTVPPDSELLDLSKDEDKKKKKLRDANDFASEALILLIDRETSTGRVAFSLSRR